MGFRRGSEKGSGGHLFGDFVSIPPLESESCYIHFAIFLANGAKATFPT